MTPPTRRVLLLGLVALAACGPDSRSAGLDPDPNAIVTIRISPGTATLAPSDTLRFRVMAVSARGDSQPASAARFESTGGTIDAAGLFRAELDGDYDVRARLRVPGGDLVSSSRVSVRTPAPPPPPPPPPAPALVGISIEPDSVSLPLGGQQAFLARARYSDGSLVLVSPNWGASLGAIGTDGSYHAPSTAGVYQIVAVLSAAGIVEVDTALVTVLAAPGPPPPPPPPPPVLVAIVLTPDSISVATGGTFQFAVRGRRSDGTTVTVPGAYGATGGHITSSGLFTAGAVAGNFKVWFKYQTANLADTSRVFVPAPPPPPPPPPPPLPPPPPPPPPSGPVGLDATLPPLFPADNPWNQPVDTAQVDPNSDAIVNLIGVGKSFHPDFGADWNGGPFGIPYFVVSGTQLRVPVSFDYADESDPGPYPIPPNAPIEGGAASGGDRHVLIVDRDAWKLYELFAAYPQPDGSWHAGSGAVFDLGSDALRPAGWTSADAAGLPILPGLVRYDEVLAGNIAHALRFTVAHTQRAYLPPARHWASSDVNPLRPPMGMRVRLKASFDLSGYPARVQVILRALQKYGMIVADNGSDWYLSGVADARWNDGEINLLKQLKGSDFEVVRMQGIVNH